MILATKNVSMTFQIAKALSQNISADADLLQQWNDSGRVFLFVPAYEKKRVDKLLPRKYAVAEVSGKFVYSNRF